MTLTGRAVALSALATVLVAAFAPTGLGVLSAAGAVLALLILDALLAQTQVSIARSGPTRVRLGDRADFELLVTNLGRHRVKGVLRDAWVPSATASPTRIPLLIPAGERRRLPVTLTPTRRGDAHTDRITLRTVGPLGLAGRQATYRANWVLRVLPEFRSRKHLPSRLRQLRELDGRSALLVRGAGTEFDSLRTYVRGDDTRAIDWRATARSSDVVVRTWRPERDRHVLIVVDTGRLSAGRIGDAPRLDTSLDAALLLAALATRAGDRVDLLAFDSQLRGTVVGAKPTELLARFTDVMAGLEPALVQTDYQGVAREIRARSVRHGYVVWLTGLDPAAVEPGLRRSLAPLAHLHRITLASVADPSVAQLRRDRSSTLAVHMAAAAERAETERLAAQSTLSRIGVDLLEAEPDQLAPALADRYLALKRAGRL